MNVYISGPMTGEPNYKAKFAAAEKHIKAQGGGAINPAKITIPESWSYDEIIAYDLQVLEKADAIYMLSGFRGSKGALIELKRALELDLPILLEEAGE